MEKARILIVDDEPSIIKYLRANLEATGYEVLAALDGTEGMRIFEKELPNLVILDVRMPETSGFEVCRQIREWSQVPIIMLTALGSVEDKVKAFDLGADDYVTKPFGKGELLARVRAVLRRTALWDEKPEPALRAGELVVDFASHRATMGGQEISLTATEYRLLSYLARNAGRVITPDQILETVWGEGYTGEHHLLRVNVGRLRQKLGDNTKEPKYVVTKTGIGYMFLKPE